MQQGKIISKCMGGTHSTPSENQRGKQHLHAGVMAINWRDPCTWVPANSFFFKSGACVTRAFIKKKSPDSCRAVGHSWTVTWHPVWCNGSFSSTVFFFSYPLIFFLLIPFFFLYNLHHFSLISSHLLPSSLTISFSVL